MAETFNSFILLARYMPIVYMLKNIRLAIMERMRKKKALVSKFVARIAPRISLKLEEAYSEQCSCECKWNGEDNQHGFEDLQADISHAVDLQKKTCSCRVWDMIGIPCCHALSAILYMNERPKDYLERWYKMDMYAKTYSLLLQPVPSSTFWNHEGDGMVLPPDIVKAKRGRRKTARRKDPNEPSKKTGKYCRRGLPVRCSNCGSTENTKKTCTAPPKPSKASQQTPNLIGTQGTQQTEASSSQATGGKKRGRPKGSKNKVGKTIDELLIENVPTLVQYVASLRPHKGRGVPSTSAPANNIPWLEIFTAQSTQGRGRTVGKGRGKATSAKGIQGIGVYHGRQGEVIQRTSLTAPQVIIRGRQPRQVQPGPSGSTAAGPSGTAVAGPSSGTAAGPSSSSAPPLQ